FALGGIAVELLVTTDDVGPTQGFGVGLVSLGGEHGARVGVDEGVSRLGITDQRGPARGVAALGRGPDLIGLPAQVSEGVSAGLLAGSGLLCDEVVLLGQQEDAVVFPDDASVLGAGLLGDGLASGGVERDARACGAHRLWWWFGEDHSGTVVGAGHGDRAPDLFAGVQIVGGGGGSGEGVVGGGDIGQHSQRPSIGVGGQREAGATQRTLRRPQDCALLIHGGEGQSLAVLVLAGGEKDAVGVLGEGVPTGVDGDHPP